MSKDRIIQIFDDFAEQYDSWFDYHTAAFESELNALKKVIPPSGEGLEVGVGSGRYASELGIKTGLEPSVKMADLAKLRNINVSIGTAESMPFHDHQFDYVLLNTVLCFLDNPLIALYEVKRILKLDGMIIIGMYDKNSLLGQSYIAHRYEKHDWLRHAHYYSVTEIFNLLHQIKFQEKLVYQTIFSLLFENIKTKEKVRPGYGEGGFVVISAQSKL